MGHTSSKSSSPSQRYKDGDLSIQYPQALKAKPSDVLSRSATTRSHTRGCKDEEDQYLSMGNHRRTRSALAGSPNLHPDSAPPSYSDAVFPGSSSSGSGSSNHLAVPGQAQNQTASRSTNNPFVRWNGSSGDVSQSSVATPSLDGYTPAERARLERLRTPMRQESYENALVQLRGYDTIILVDDSGSMAGSRWTEARRALAKLADVARDYDENGLDIYFLNSKLKIRGCKESSDVMRLFDRVRPSGITPIGERLNVLLNDYLDDLDRAKRYNNQLPKPVNILVLTDGVPTDDPQSVIEYAARRLDKDNYLLNQVGIQFVQIGNERNATEYLRQLDDDLAATGIRDIVDTTPYIGEVSSDMIIKILLGGINRREDRKKV
ncbi:hypothetical protein C8T65DRAFT_137640 [Cerioporus squamosus]|nr:hypothetical protein C8T65DRAFT_137640 [Cerioporus squamosus]